MMTATPRPDGDDGTTALTKLVLAGAAAALVVLTLTLISLFAPAAGVDSASITERPAPAAPSIPARSIDLTTDGAVQVPAAADMARVEERAALTLADDPDLVIPPSLQRDMRPASESTIVKWIWESDRVPGHGAIARFRRRFEIAEPPESARLTISGDNSFRASLDGAEIAHGSDWSQPAACELDGLLDAGPHELIIEVTNEGGPAALAARLEIRSASSTRVVVTDRAWEAISVDPSASAAPGHWSAAHELASLGQGPWGALTGFGTEGTDRDIRVRRGFDVQHIFEIPPALGSIVSLTVDPQGRFVMGAQRGGLYRLDMQSKPLRAELLSFDAGGPQGLAFVGDDLFAFTNEGGRDGAGLYRLRDGDQDGTFESCELVRGVPGGEGEHGVHGLVVGPDGLLYLVAGNHSPLPPVVERSRVPRVWNEDFLLERLWDANGHAVNIFAPGGWICRLDPKHEPIEQSPWELIAIGMRNAYDLAFHPQGDLFTWDSDMEWDMGTSWYRPTALFHVTSGAEFGWRSGTARWPAHWEDSLPAALDVGPGSPTGMLFGTGTNFPSRWRDALFMLDWTFGTIHALHLSPHGASWRAEREVFLTGKPLPLTDAVVRPQDQSLYFAVGGRSAASALYRVVALDPSPSTDDRPARRDTPLAAARRMIELGHDPAQSTDEAAIEEAWPALAHEDRFIRFAARTALELRAPGSWGERALSEPSVPTRLAALLALVRSGGPSWHARLVSALLEIDPATLPPDLRRRHARTWMLLLARYGPPAAAEGARLRAQFESVFPSDDPLLNRDAGEILVFLDSPVVVSRGVALMERTGTLEQASLDRAFLSRGSNYGEAILRMNAAPPQAEQVHYALILRLAERGWNDDLRDRYFGWFAGARRQSGGLSFAGFLDRIVSDALDRAPADQRKRLASLAQGAPRAIPGARAQTLPRGPDRAWTMESLASVVAEAQAPRRFERGRELFEGALCAACHRFAGAGGEGGPDLTTAGSRFSRRDLLLAILEPSRVIADEYRWEEFTLADDRVILGRAVTSGAREIEIRTSLLDPHARESIDASAIRSRATSPVSPMMPHLLDTMNEGEIRDLLAYIISGGNPADALFNPPGAGAWRDLFDGQSLASFEDPQRRFSVEEGAIIGRVSADAPLERNTFLRWTQSLPEHFELRAEIRLAGDNNSGIQYRSSVTAEGGIAGLQCDVHPHPPYHGMFYEEGGAGIIAQSGTEVRLAENTILRSWPVEPFAQGAWHEYTILAQGSRIEHRIDGVTVAILHDDASRQGDAAPSGQHPRSPRGQTLAFQLHTGEPYEVHIRSIRLRELPRP